MSVNKRFVSAINEYKNKQHMRKDANNASGTEMYLSASFLTYVCLYSVVTHIIMRTAEMLPESNEHSDSNNRRDIRVTFPEDTTPISASRG
jgi:hypothetical protein